MSAVGLRTFSEPTAHAVPDSAQPLVPLGSVHVKFQFNPHARGLIPEPWISPWQRDVAQPTCKFPSSKHPQGQSTAQPALGLQSASLYPSLPTSQVRTFRQERVEGKAAQALICSKLFSNNLPQHLGLPPSLSFFCLLQRSTKLYSWTKSCPSSVFAHEVLLEHSHTCLFLYLFLHCWWWSRDCNKHWQSIKLKIFTNWPFTEKVGWPLVWYFLPKAVLCYINPTTALKTLLGYLDFTITIRSSCLKIMEQVKWVSLCVCVCVCVHVWSLCA